jgi:hypothetical protein
MSRHCPIHGTFIYYDHEACPRCVDAERGVQAGLDRIATDLAERASPLDSGDFYCPHCRYRTLRQGATRCPSCHGAIDDGFWRRLAAAARQEEEERQAAAAKRAAQERDAQAARAVEELRARDAAVAATAKARRRGLSGPVDRGRQCDDLAHSSLELGHLRGCNAVPARACRTKRRHLHGNIARGVRRVAIADL